MNNSLLEDFIIINRLSDIIKSEERQGNEYNNYHLLRRGRKYFFFFHNYKSTPIVILSAEKNLVSYNIYKFNVLIATLKKTFNGNYLYIKNKKKNNIVMYCNVSKKINSPRVIKVALPDEIFFNCKKSEIKLKKKFQNKKPRYSHRIKSYTLNLLNAKMSSSKNCQLIDDMSNIFFEFGKLNDSLFSIMFKHPISILQAFGIALSLF